MLPAVQLSAGGSLRSLDSSREQRSYSCIVDQSLAESQWGRDPAALGADPELPPIGWERWLGGDDGRVGDGG